MAKNRMLLYLFFIIPLIIDRVSKWLILQFLVEPYEVNQFFSLDFVINRGISLGIFHSENNIIFGLITISIIFIIIGLTWHIFSRAREEKKIIGELLILSGAFSNLIDRFYYAGVVDFILISFNGWDFPIFNVADAVIIIGVVLMIFALMRESKCLD